MPAVSDQRSEVRNPIDAFILARLREGGADAAARGRPVRARPPRRARPDRPAADAGRGRRVRQRQLAATPTRSSSIGCSRSRPSASTGRGCGSTWPATPTRAGYADDPPRTIWTYRDYVINAFNANKPFDQFTIEQLAGDLLPNPTTEQLVATAFHRNTLTNNEGGTNDEEFRNVAVVDRVNTTFTVWMGTSMACAQCHTHKYDPITQKEYFQLFAFFNNTADADRAGRKPDAAVLDRPELLRTKAELETQLVIDLEATAEGQEAGRVEAGARPARGAQEGTGRGQAADDRADHEGADRAQDRRKTRLQFRGNFLDLGDEVTEGTPAAFHPLPEGRAAEPAGAREVARERRTTR